MDFGYQLDDIDDGIDSFNIFKKVLDVMLRALKPLLDSCHRRMRHIQEFGNFRLAFLLDIQ
jgi:hypothetical protein